MILLGLFRCSPYIITLSLMDLMIFGTTWSRSTLKHLLVSGNDDFLQSSLDCKIVCNSSIRCYDTCENLFHFFSFSFSGKHYTGSAEIFAALSDIRNTLAGDLPSEKLVHVVEKLQCRPHSNGGVMIRAVGSFIVGNQFLICGDGVQAEGLPSFKDLGIDIESRRMGRFQEQFVVEPGDLIGRYFIAKQELYITN